MAWRFLLFIIVFFSIYGGINYYIGLRGWQALFSTLGFINIKVYWIVFGFIVMAYILERILNTHLSPGLNKILTLIGSYWMAAMYFLFFLILFVDLIRILNKKYMFLPEKIMTYPHLTQATALVVIFVITCLLIYGTWNAYNPRAKEYSITIPKQAGSFDELHVVMVSDVHLNQIVNKKHFQKIVKEINKLNPDIILLAGDIIDSSIDYFTEEKLGEVFLKLKAPQGVYAVMGNHEYISGYAEEHITNLEDAGVTVLRDSHVKVANSFFVAGRDDRSAQRFTGKTRLSLAEILENVDNHLPIFLLDHQPYNLEEAQENGVDLQLSGHTHKGQFFPNSLITNRIYENDWGYLKKGNFHVIVSSGVGIWGPPIRLGSHSEIVSVKITFAQEKTN